MNGSLATAARSDWFGPLLVTLAAIVIVGGMKPSFLSPLNIQVLLLAIAVNGLVAYSQMIIIAIGQMNLSVGAIGGLCAIVFAGMMDAWQVPAPIAAISALLLGLVCGAINGLLIARTGISAFVITLATLSLYKGINLGVTRAQPFYNIFESVKAFGQGSVFGIIPWLMIPTIIVALALWYMLNRQPIGRFILAVGGNQHAAELSGISVATTVVTAHALSGFLAALAGLLLVARLQMGQPTIGDDWLILSFAAPVIGGAVLAGGHVSVPATLLGVVIVAIITQALVLFDIDPFLVQVVLGAMILAAVGANRFPRKPPVAKRWKALNMTGQTTFQAIGIEKSFPGVKALKGVGLTLSTHSIHALLGENGAGKSTLIKIITGVHRPDAGRLLLDGKEVQFGSPREAISHHIGVVHQEHNLIPRFSVAENIHLEQLGASLLKPVDYGELNRQAARWLEALGLDIDPRTPVSRLSVAKMQLVEIAKALSLRSKVLLLDEPTASLTSSEADLLFGFLRKLRDNGASLLFVSHKLEEVQELCDSVTVLRDGANACESRSMEGLGRQDIVRMMIGRAEGEGGWRKRDTTGAPVALALKNVDTSLGHSDLNLSVRKGEIVGLYGLVGAGRTELAKCILGQFPLTAGTVEIGGRPVTIGSVAEAIHKYRLGYVSEDRKGEGLVLMHSVLGNAGIAVWRPLSRLLGFLTDRLVRHKVTPFIEKLEVKTPSLSQTVANLSGGNQQKISVAKWLAAGVNILLVDEPSVGIDIKTKAYLHDLLRELADNGTAVLLITSDMTEMILLADRVLVMNDYRLQGEIVNDGSYAGMSEAIMNLIHQAEPV